MWQVEVDLENDGLILTKEGKTITIPRQSVRLEGFESSQDHTNPIDDLVELDKLFLEYEGATYEIPEFVKLDSNTQETLLEWYSPT